MKGFLLLISIMGSFSIAAQRSIHGQLLHQLTAEPVAGATIIAGSGGTVISDQQGKFSINTGADSIIVTAVGFEKKTILLDNREHLLILLQPSQKKWMPWWYRVPCGP
ncbi:MAG: hypothetical protein IPG86_13940 [Chitinophagaceae bacterium]|nr:hypothetical protein [Chitinophagaceae bacterium]